LELQLICIFNRIHIYDYILIYFLAKKLRLLRSERDSLPDVPAIYFISPTSENIARLCQDLKNELYEQYYLNFISPIPRSLLEDIAQAAIAANCVQQITKVIIILNLSSFFLFKILICKIGIRSIFKLY